MPQPKDYVDGYDPYKTDPNFVQLYEHEVNLAPNPNKRSNYGNEHEVPNMPTNQRPKRVIRKRAPELSPTTHDGSSMFKSFLDFLIPPLSDHPERVRRWRISVGLSLFVLFMNLTLSYGWYQIFGFSGFAYASTVKEIKVGLLEKDLFDTIKSHCVAPTAESKDFYYKQKTKILQRYTETTGSYFRPIPTCKDLGVREVIVGGP